MNRSKKLMKKALLEFLFCVVFYTIQSVYSSHRIISVILWKHRIFDECIVGWMLIEYLIGVSSAVAFCLFFKGLFDLRTARKLKLFAEVYPERAAFLDRLAEDEELFSKYFRENLASESVVELYRNNLFSVYGCHRCAYLVCFYDAVRAEHPVGFLIEEAMLDKIIEAPSDFLHDMQKMDEVEKNQRLVSLEKDEFIRWLEQLKDKNTSVSSFVAKLYQERKEEKLFDTLATVGACMTFVSVGAYLISVVPDSFWWIRMVWGIVSGVIAAGIGIVSVIRARRRGIKCNPRAKYGIYYLLIILFIFVTIKITDIKVQREMEEFRIFGQNS